MTHRTFDEQIANFNRVVSSWDINQEYKVALLGMIASLGYEHEKSITPEPHWIPVTERLPEEPFGCLVTVWDTSPITMEEFENILPYFVGGDGEQWNDADGEQCPFEVLAWWGLPEPFKDVTE
jgi:hypothetical protein